MQMLFPKFIRTKYEENIAMGRFTTSAFRAVDHAKPVRFVCSYIPEGGGALRN